MFEKFKERLVRKAKERAREIGGVGVAALLIGVVAGALNVDLAPEQVDTLVTAGAVLAYVWREWSQNRKAAE